MSAGEAISPTAHYTGYVWARNGLSHPELATREGRLLFESTRPTILLSRALGGPTLEGYLVARHTALDELLRRAIDQDGVTHVIEIACGLSPRGWRFNERYGEQLTYIETDLPAMAARKRAALERMGSLGEHHRVEVVDALRDAGEHTLGGLVRGIDRGARLAIVSEGLVGYLSRGHVEDMWRRFARELAGFAGGRYLSDIHLRSGLASPFVRVFSVALAAFVRGRVHWHFEDAAEAEAALRQAGFSSAAVLPAAPLAALDRGNDPGADLAYAVDARI
jgi:O-methyltransferase involved in polyketide biosynthesis